MLKLKEPLCLSQPNLAETSLDDRDLALFKVPREDNYEIAKIQIYQVSNVAHGPLVNKRVLKL